MTAGARRRRRIAWASSVATLLSASALPAVAQDTATPPQVLSPQLAADLRACLRLVSGPDQDDPLGTRRIAVAQLCPSLAAQLAERPVPGMPGRRLDDGSMSVRQLSDLVRLVEAAAEPVSSRAQLSSVRLGLIIEALDPAARGELSTRARLARWWRSVVGEFDPTQRAQRAERRRVAWPLGFWSTVSWIAFAIAALLVVTVLVQELRAALALRARAGRSVVRRERRRERPPDLAAIDALPPRERAGALLSAVAARLHARGALAPPGPLTPREVGNEARLPESGRAGLQLIASVGEAGAFGREEPTAAALAAARAAAVPWLEDSDALARLRAWRASGAAGAAAGARR